MQSFRNAVIEEFGKEHNINGKRKTHRLDSLVLERMGEGRRVGKSMV